MNLRHAMLVLLAWCLFPIELLAQRKIPPYDLWTPQILADIRNQNTLFPTVSQANPLIPLYDVYFVSDSSANYFDITPPNYAEHVGEKITIHGYLAIPFTPGPHPALVFGHGHGGQADPNLATTIAILYADIPLPAGSISSTAAWVSIDAAVPVAARLEATGDNDPWSIDARPAPSPGASLTQPHVEWNGIFTTRLLVLNTSTSAQLVTFKLHVPDNSAAASTVTRSVAGGSILSDSVESIFSLSANVHNPDGWLEVQAAGGGVLVTALAVDPKGGAAAASPLGSGGAGTWSMPYFVNGFGYWTGLALANAGPTKADFQITAYDSNGTVLGQYSGSLEPQNCQTKLIYQWMSSLPADATGQIIITTTAPIALLAYFGTGDGASLAAIPFTPIAP